MRVCIHFAGVDSLSLHDSQVSEQELRALPDWFRDEDGSEVKAIRYDTNGTTGDYIFYRDNIACVKTQED